ncbi:uncharacterized protein LOC118448242 isoform X1 [Vespa mandarinia]|uniref:uncharacterized protein LOC118448242 isoform X1 n=1 Tax=Vespa mandarinia TaxID=7446 RepID=UPI001620A0B5|nr:uncharacterized protein LOC118448242 isoform X1 [Vespa mandarinia]XP_035737163.1 uncharacterized protein LOC118448242 isoform X1 [Vespa mandarinia]XP_035737164.1 uncharacterized protein LOC118448242 isoform X1 [Vespa mandarinia]XP_035737165.1 uncharacterized protein LOC118448242 isoform X1 [Vespa mandarinia]
MFNEPKILIIGAGAAGISAAKRLLEKGLQNITILEAGDRIGGRIHTVEFADNVVELGAQWVHGERGNVVFNLAFPHKLLDSSKILHDFNKQIFVTPKGKIIPQERSIESLKAYYDISDRSMEDLKNAIGSYGEYFCNEFYKIMKEKSFTDKEEAELFLDWFHKFDNSIQCSDTWFDVSAKGITEYWQCEGDSLLNWKTHGYKTLFDLLLNKIPDSKETLMITEKIKFNKEVFLIDYTSTNNVIVKVKDGSKYNASHVIFTASLGVLKEKHSMMFLPSLSERKQRAIKGLSIGTVNKVFLEFPYIWWKEECAGFSLAWTKEDKIQFLESHGQDNAWLCDVFTFFTVDYQPRVLCAWVVRRGAKYIETLSDIDIIEGLYLLLETFLGKSHNIPRPDHMIRSNWYTNSNFRGCYTFQSMMSEKLNVRPKDLAEPIMSSDNKPLILFAGEATHDHYYSTVHGAVESGFREADRLLQYQRIHGWLRQTINDFEKIRKIQTMKIQPIGKPEVVIIGAGIAGLAAAKALEDANFKNYLLLEAQEQIGGRIQSTSWNENWIEYGAQFLHGGQSKLAKLCNEKQLLSNIQCKDGEGVFLSENGLEIDLKLVEEIDNFVRNILEECENRENQEIQNNFENIGRILRSRFRNYLQQSNDITEIKDIKKGIFDWMTRFLIIDNSCFTLDELSLKGWGNFKFVGGPEYLSFKTEYSSILKLIADNLDPNNLYLNSAVEVIEWQQNININESEKSIVLTLSDERQIFTKCVIITCSLGHLKENYQNMFVPPLPFNYTLGIECLGFGLINKIFLDFGHSWWKSETKGFQFIWHKNNINVFSEKSLATWTKDLTGFDVLQNHQGVLLGWVGGQGASIIETLSEEEVANDCLNLFKYFLKVDNIPKVQRCIRTQWNANKYIRGSYSHISVNCDRKKITPGTLAEPIWGTITQQNCTKIVPVIMFAGEGTHDNFYSTTHGAYETGLNQAQTFLRYYVN